jgi:hypothetical protein
MPTRRILLSEQSDKLFHRQPGLFDDASERAAFEILAVKRDNHQAPTHRMSEEAMGTGAMVKNKAGAPQRLYNVGGLAGRQSRHGLKSHRNPLNGSDPGFNRDLLPMLPKAF